MFSQKTEYELRISDWSSDVCSSDLLGEQSVIGGAKTLDFFGPDIVRLLRGEAVAGGQVAPDVPEFLEVDLFRAFRDLGPERRGAARAAAARDALAALDLPGQPEERLRLCPGPVEQRGGAGRACWRDRGGRFVK